MSLQTSAATDSAYAFLEAEVARQGSDSTIDRLDPDLRRAIMAYPRERQRELAQIIREAVAAA